jgi:methylmalonyl-CoA mutase N-terminal domain/subunit
VDLDAVARRLSSFFSAGSDLFEEVAKYRGARRLYHERLSERFPLTDERSTRLRFHVQTAGSSLTAQQPLNNITRAAYQALAAVLGGAQSLHVSAYDEALCVPSEAAAITALRTQQVLAAETGVTRTVDPLGGSHYVESLTDELQRRAERLLAEIDGQGGLVCAVESGWVHRLVLDTAYRRQLAVASGELEIVGVNAHTGEVPARVELFRVPETVGPQSRKLAALRARRDGGALSARLEALRRAAAGSDNTLPALVDAVRAGATLGECCQVFRDLHGGWRQPLA